MVKAAMVRDFQVNRGAPARPTEPRSLVAESAATWVVGGLALIGAVVLGSLLAVVFAVTLAVAVVLTLLLMAAAVLTQKPRQLKAVRANSLDGGSAEVRAVMDARKVGHSWVAYGWDKDA